MTVRPSTSGSKGLLVNSTNLCTQANHAVVKLDGQNGKVSDTNPVMTNSCGGNHVTRHAGLSRATFYQHFPAKRHCLLAAYDAFFERLSMEVSVACEAELEWAAKVRAAVETILAHLAEASTMARAFTVESFASGPPALERQLTMIERLAALLRDGRRHHPAIASLPVATEKPWSAASS